MTSKVQYDEVTEKRPAKSGSSTKRFTEKVNAEVFLIDRLRFSEFSSNKLFTS